MLDATYNFLNLFLILIPNKLLFESKWTTTINTLKISTSHHHRSRKPPITTTKTSHPTATKTQADPKGTRTRTDQKRKECQTMKSTQRMNTVAPPSIPHLRRAKIIQTKRNPSTQAKEEATQNHQREGKIVQVESSMIVIIS